MKNIVSRALCFGGNIVLCARLSVSGIVAPSGLAMACQAVGLAEACVAVEAVWAFFPSAALVSLAVTFSHYFLSLKPSPVVTILKGGWGGVLMSCMAEVALTVLCVRHKRVAPPDQLGVC